MASALPTFDRSRVGWWLLTIVVGVAVAFVLYTFVGTFVFGVFIYYGMRPLNRRLESVFSSGIAAAVTIVVVAVPALLLVGSLLAVGVHEIDTVGGLDAIRNAVDPFVDLAGVENPVNRLRSAVSNLGTGSVTGALATGAGVLATLTGGVFHVFIAATLGFYLLRDDRRLADWYRSTVGGEGSASYAYASAVDRGLGSIYFGNVLLIGLVALLAAVVYHGFNLVAPASVSIPLPTALAVLTGLASLLPIVVGKIVYVPLTLYLGAVAYRTDPSLLVYPVAFVAVCFVVLDLVPMTFLLPKVAGQKTHTGLVLFAYILGTALFGWYGLFLGPLLLVLGVQVVRIAFTELLAGEPVSPAVTAARGIGADPDPADAEESGAGQST